VAASERRIGKSEKDIGEINGDAGSKSFRKYWC
jgi:hypothetical protein